MFVDRTCCACVLVWRQVAAWSKRTTSIGAPERMAYSSALVPSLSTHGTADKHAVIIVETTSLLGGSRSQPSSPMNNAHALSQARCSGVLPSVSGMAHAIGQASTSIWIIEKLARVPAAMWSGVRFRQSTRIGDSGRSSSRALTMGAGGLNRAQACRL